jgi:hypothetical protein
MEFLMGILISIWVNLPYAGVAFSFVFKEEIQAWWKGLRAKYVNNTYEGSIHWMKSHNFGLGEYVRVDFEKSRGKGAGCHITYINSGRTACLPWSVYSQYEFQEILDIEKQACNRAIKHNANAAYGQRITVESLLEDIS